MASGGSARDDYKSKNSEFNPRSNRRPPRYGTSFDAELSLNSELQRSEAGETQPLPNNLTWTSGTAHEPQNGKSKARKYSDDPPTKFSRKKHTPATLPRTKFSSSAYGGAQHRAIDGLKQHLSFSGDEDSVGEEYRVQSNGKKVDLPAKKERNVRQDSSGSPQRNQTSQNGTYLPQSENGNTANGPYPPVDSSKIIERLKQVREYLKQATSLFIALNSKSTTPDEATDDDLDQMDKLAKLIKHLKTQEATYVDFVQRSIAVRHESSMNNTPSTSVMSLDGENPDDVTSEQSEDVEELRQQQLLLRKIIEQQKQLKELQDRQNELLNLQRAAENQLKEVENEGMRMPSTNGDVNESPSRRGNVGSTNGRNGTERAEDSRSPMVGAVGGDVSWRQLNREEQPQAIRNKRPSDRKPENFKNQRPVTNQPALVYESTGSVTPDNEAQALAMADAAQERLELESRLMDLQEKKREMDSLVEQLQQLREMQLGKEIALSQERSVNETSQNGEEDVPFTTKSAKDTGDNVDDEKILEALQLHKKLRKLQDVRDKLERLKDLFGDQQEPLDGGNEERTTSNGRASRPDQDTVDDTASESARESATEDDEAGRLNEMPPGSLDWILNSGIDDPELLAKLRQVKAAKERVANLKQFSEQNNSPSGPTLSSGAGPSGARVEDEDSGVVGETDNETTGSVSSSLMWQEDPEFQEKLRKLNAARKKLRKLQELVKRTEELPNGPNGEPYLPAELIDMSFSSDETDESDEEAADPGRNDGLAGNAEKDDDDEDETSETLVDDSAKSPEDDVDTESAYMDKLTKQREALSDLILERQKLLETQEQFKRLQRADAMTQTKVAAKSKKLQTFIRNPTEAGTSSKLDTATQTRDDTAEKYQQRSGALPSNSLLWLELRRQRELQEQKLKKRKERLMLEKKRRRYGLENSSEGGANSVEDEGFGRSTLSADITTATWGGSTQVSSTQNDSAVSDQGSSHASDEEILVQVEDDPCDGIVQAEEEEEANSETEIFPTATTGRRKQESSRMKQNATEKRLLFEGLRKRDLERHERFKGWQTSVFSSGNKKNEAKAERFSNPKDVMDEDDRYNRERSMWERQFSLQQNQLENTTSLCNTLLRDQQTLISVLLNRAENPRPSFSAPSPNSFSRYQQRQQEAFQGIQNYFQQQRFLVQQQQMLQNLTECYSQMQQQHEDMLHLQNSFSQLFTQPSTDGGQTRGLPTNSVPFSSQNRPAASPFSFRPEQTPPPSPLSNQANTAARQPKKPETSGQQAYDFGRSSWPSGLRNRQFKFVGSTNPETGVPSPESKVKQNYKQSPVQPVSARVVSAPTSSPGNPSVAYDSTVYADSKGEGTNVVVGKQFPTPLRAAAAAQLAGQDKSSWAGMKRRRDDAFQNKMETDSVSSHQSSLPGDSEKPGTESDAHSDYSLFEALRDSIYSEVATLISQNESRPHFLIELFRELQLLSSDYLRQRALYSLRDLVTRFLKDDPPGINFESTVGDYPWVQSGSERTPSESAGFSETDQDQIKVPEISTQGIYDYVEAVESGSTLSTPNSTGHEPFASDLLGETVIHLDKALKTMRERERRESEDSIVEVTGKGYVQNEEVASSTGDVASESSLPDIQYPKIDTQALDRQIKKIMAEVIPCLNDHMEETCSVDLLEYIRKMVMGMIQQKNEGREFSRFFHKQLESILQDSLAKFIGKRMKDCGEDLLVDISEILFNELAFFKLMQELDGGASKAKFFSRQQKYVVPDASAPEEQSSSTKTNVERKAADDDDGDDDEEEDEVEIEVEAEDVEDQEAEDGDSSGSSGWQIIEEKQDEKKDESAVSREQLERDEESLGRDRDDAMAEEFDEPRSHAEEAATESSQCVNTVELSVSESRPLASNGSGEDESEVEENEEAPAGEIDEDAEGIGWNGGVNGSQGSPQQNEQGSQMAATGSATEQGTSSGNQEKQEDEQDDDLPTKFTGLTEADLQVKIAEEQSRNDGIRGIALSINDGEELVGDANIAPEPEGAHLVNGEEDEPEK